MLVKSSIVVYVHKCEEEFIDQIINDYEDNNWALILEKQLVDDDSDSDITWML